MSAAVSSPTQSPTSASRSGTAAQPGEAPPAPDRRRSDDVDKAKAGVDVIFVGGGINGTAAARDAAMRGLKVLVVEQGDWGSGTSSKSSKLVHGGLRYLENYEFGLVMEGTRERHRQQTLNPHLVTPLPFLMPVYKGGRHSLFKINLGLWLYDLLSLFRTYKMHKKLAPAKTAVVAPPLRQDALSGSVLYYDCATDDARLTLANALDARRRGALVMSRARYVGPVFEGARVKAAKILDLNTGETFLVPTGHIAMATGAWTDRTGALSGDAPRLRPTKGVHLVFASERLPLDVAVAMSSVDDGRVVFAIPFGNTTYVGTTDTDFPGDPSEVYATESDVAYLLRTANFFFPAAALTPGDVRSTWAGLRPLIKSDAETAYKTSREHEIFDDTRGLSTIAGGKLTTYRAMAQEHVDHVVMDLKRSAKASGLAPRKLDKCRTAKVPLDEATTRTPPAASDAELAAMLWRTHGSLAAAVEQRLVDHPAESARVTPDLPYLMAQVAVAALYEDAWTLEDVLVRRLQVHFRAADAGRAAAVPVARLLGRVLGRSDAWVAGEVAAFTTFVDRQLACRDALLVSPGEALVSDAQLSLDDAARAGLAQSA